MGTLISTLEEVQVMIEDSRITAAMGEQDWSKTTCFFCDPYGNGEAVELPAERSEVLQAIEATIDGIAEAEFWRSPRGRSVAYHYEEVYA